MPSLTSDPLRNLRLYSILLICLLAGLGFHLHKGLQLDTDILELLPPTEKDPVVAKAMQAFTRQMSHRIVFLIGHADGEVARSAAASLQASLEDSAFFSKVQAKMPESMEKDFYDLYFPYRMQLLSPEARSNLKQQGATYFVRDALTALNSPMSGLYASMLTDDPLLRFASFLKGMPQPPGSLKVRHGWLSVQEADAHFVMLTATTQDSAFSPSQQQTILGLLDSTQAQLIEDADGLSIDRTGVLDYAAAGSATAQREVSTIGLGSILGVIVLFAINFRGPRPLFLGLLPIATGLLCGALACFVVFGRIHLLTLGFGASIIGICIDYCFHYYCERLGETEAQPQKALVHILPAISLGALTSILGYCGLLMAPFPGLRQMALFSAAGLLGAFLTVVLAFPALANKAMQGPPAPRRLAAILLKVLKAPPTWLLLTVAVCLVPVTAWGLYHLQANDDIRALQTPDPALKRQESRIRERIGGFDGSRFLLVEGKDHETLLQNEEALKPILADLIDKGGLAYAQTMSTLVPSRQQQQQDHDHIAKALDSKVSAYVDSLGLDLSATQTIESLLQPPQSFLDLETWLAHPASQSLRDLYIGQTERGVASMIVLGGLTDYAAIEAIAADNPAITYIDKVASLSELLRNYRHRGGWLAALSYLLVAMVIFWRYGIKQGSRVMLPAILAAAITLALFGLLGLPISLFNILALLLVLGIGIDYTIFFAESGDQPAATMHAIMLSATTTLLSFGLLALSSVAFLQSFGLTVLFGITTAFLTAPLALRGTP